MVFPVDSQHLRRLAVFHAVAEGHGIGAAAASLDVTQSAVSQQLAALEQALNLDLCERAAGRRVRLTAAGEVLFHHTRQLAAVLTAADQAMTELQDQPRRELTLAAGQSTGTYLMPGLVASLRRRWPELRIDITIVNNTALVDVMRERQADFACWSGTLPSREWSSQVLGTDRLVPIAPIDHPVHRRRRKLTPADLVKHALVLREPASGTRAALDAHLAARDLSADPVLELGNHEAVVHAVEAGLGLGVVSSLALAAHRGGRVCEIESVDLDIARPIHLAWRRTRLLTPALDTVVALALAHCREVLER